MVSIKEHVAAIEYHLAAIAEIFQDPTAILFQANTTAIVALERAGNLKAGIDAAIAYAADQARAGDRVGSSRTVDYLITELGLSYREAITRLELGHRNHGVVTPAPTPEPEAETDGAEVPEGDGSEGSAAGEDPADKQRREAEEHRRREAEEVARREAARRKAREEGRRTRISKEKLAILNQELTHLNPHARTSRDELYAQGVDQAGQRTPEDLRDWIRAKVAAVNRHTRDPYAGWTRRRVTISSPDPDGGAWFKGYAPAETLALLEAALAPAQRPGYLMEDPSAADHRSLAQRRHDGLFQILRNHSAVKAEQTGVATVVVSMSAKDIDTLGQVDAGHRFATNTTAMLTPVEILRLGAAKYQFVVVHDPATGDPLHVGRTRRIATVEQRLGLFAAELGCTRPGCTQPLCRCEVHHLRPWGRGGETDVENLTVLCRAHHGDNRDQRDGKGSRGHAQRDPITGRVGYQPPPRPGDPDPAVRLNTTQRQEYSGGAKVRTQPWPQAASDPPVSSSTQNVGGVDPPEAGDDASAPLGPDPGGPAQEPLFPDPADTPGYPRAPGARGSGDTGEQAA